MPPKTKKKPVSKTSDVPECLQKSEPMQEESTTIAETEPEPAQQVPQQDGVEEKKSTKATKSKQKKKASLSTIIKKKRAPSSYVLFAIDYRNVNKESHKNMSLGDVSKLCGEAWKSLPESEKDAWKSKSEEKRQEMQESAPPSPMQEIKKKRPPTSYVLFSMEERQKIVQEFPNLKLGDISKKCGEAWKALSDESKNEWKAKAALGAA
jgi:hypothetical protein